MMNWTLLLWAGVTASSVAGQHTMDRSPVAVPMITASSARYAPCPLPGVPPRAKVVVFSTYGAETLSSVAVGGPDEETNLMDVVIEPGREPLYLVLSSYQSMLWRLSGATGRLARVVVSSAKGELRSIPLAPVTYPRPGSTRITKEPWDGPAAPREDSASGVIGVARQRVHIAKTNCPRYFEASSAKTASADMRAALGRAPDAAFSNYSSKSVTLPSGRIGHAPRGAMPAPEGFDSETWQDAVRYWPGGLANIRARDVVAAVPGEPYAVLPSQMGLSRLVGSGAARRVERDTFRVVRPIAHMPPSMGGAHAVRLIFAKGVPVPPGDPVHSCIVREGRGNGRGASCNRHSD